MKKYNRVQPTSNLPQASAVNVHWHEKWGSPTWGPERQASGRPHWWPLQRDAAIAAALAAYSTTGEVSGLASALVDYSTTGEMNAAIASGGRHRSLGLLHLRPNGRGHHGRAGARGLEQRAGVDGEPADVHVRAAEPALPCRTTQILWRSTATATRRRRPTRRPRSTAVAAAVDALNISQHATDSEVSAIAANGFDASQYCTRTQSDSRYFVQTANAGFTSLIRDNVTPPTIRALLPRAPLSTNVLFSSTTVELLCDAYSKAEADGRYVQSGNLTSLDSRYFVTTANASFHVSADTVVPRQIKALLPRASLSINELFSSTALELLRDAYSKSERPVRRRLRARRRAGGAAGEHQRHRRAGLAGHRAGGQRRRARGRQLHQPHGQQLREHAQLHGDRTGVDALLTQHVQTPLLRPISAVDDHLSLAAGLVSIRFLDTDGVAVLAYFAVRTRCHQRLTIDDVSCSSYRLLPALALPLEVLHSALQLLARAPEHGQPCESSRFVLSRASERSFWPLLVVIAVVSTMSGAAPETRFCSQISWPGTFRVQLPVGATSAV